jgi:hypothetical protein
MSDYTSYDFERTEAQFSEHPDYEKMNFLKNEITHYFIYTKGEYTDEKVIMATLMKMFSDIERGPVNLCIECGIDMGECNPRQYCGKYYCSNR